MKHFILLLSLILLNLGCNSQQASKTDKAAVIQLAIDASLKLDPGLNTPNFYIDFSSTNYLDQSSTNEFLKLNKNFERVNADSLLEVDSTWKQYGYLDKMLIITKDVEIKGNSMIIELDKIKATDGSNGIEIILQKENNKWRVASSKITRIS